MEAVIVTETEIVTVLESEKQLHEILPACAISTISLVNESINR